jgi:lysyl-tRNA synthetase class 2
VRVGGRVVAISERRLELADALARVAVRGREELVAEVGDLVVCEGRFAGRGLHDAEVFERHRAPAPRGDGEHARLSFSGVGKRLAARARGLEVVRRYFTEQRFIEVETPARIHAPAPELHIDAVAAQGSFLITSPELQLKRLLVGGLPRIYRLASCFRAGEQGPLHEPEFTLIEWYRAFAGVDAVIADTEALVARVVEALTGRSRVRLGKGRAIDVTPPFERMSLRQAFRRYAGIADGVALAESDESQFFELLVTRIEPALARRRRPVFLYDYPATQSSLARASATDAAVAERFELYVGGVELCNGFGELSDPREQRARFERDRRERRRRGRSVYPLDERFLSALSEGMPPSAGNALGLDRLLMLALGVSNIADVQAFPSSWI